MKSKFSDYEKISNACNHEKRKTGVSISEIRKFGENEVKNKLKFKVTKLC
jgi:hypothetical protein